MNRLYVRLLGVSAGHEGNERPRVLDRVTHRVLDDLLGARFSDTASVSPVFPVFLFHPGFESLATALDAGFRHKFRRLRLRLIVMSRPVKLRDLLAEALLYLGLLVVVLLDQSFRLLECHEGVYAREGRLLRLELCGGLRDVVVGENSPPDVRKSALVHCMQGSDRLTAYLVSWLRSLYQELGMFVLLLCVSFILHQVSCRVGHLVARDVRRVRHDGL